MFMKRRGTERATYSWPAPTHHHPRGGPQKAPAAPPTQKQATLAPGLAPPPIDTGDADAHKQRVEDLRKLFAKIDEDGDGNLNRREVMLACRDDTTINELFKVAGSAQEGKSKRERFDKLFGAIDADGGGTISWDEFLAFFMREGIISEEAGTASYEVMVEKDKMGITLSAKLGEGRHVVEQIANMV